MSNSNNNSTISSVTANSGVSNSNSNSAPKAAANKPANTPAKKTPSAKQLKMKENMAAAAAKLRAIPGWTPTAANITGLMGVMRAKGDENTFIRHAISRYEKRQIDKEIQEEEKSKTAKKPRVFKVAKSAVVAAEETPVAAPSNNKTAKKKRAKKVKANAVATSTNAVVPLPVPAANNKTAKKKRAKKVKANAPATSTNVVAPGPVAAAPKKTRAKKAKANAPAPAPSSSNSTNTVGTAVIIDATAPTTAAKNASKKRNDEEINI